MRREKDVRKVIVFGLLLTSVAPNGLDVAIFLVGDEANLPLTTKYRTLPP